MKQSFLITDVRQGRALYHLCGHVDKCPSSHMTLQHAHEFKESFSTMEE